jgi:hypothetical protein
MGHPLPPRSPDRINHLVAVGPDIDLLILLDHDFRSNIAILERWLD